VTYQETEKVAREVYQEKFRLSGESYYEHSQKIVKKLKSYGIKDELTLTTALLHHALDEKSEQVANLIKKELGKEVSEMVLKYDSLTETRIKTEALKDFNEKYLIQTFVNLVDDIRLLIIRAVDKLVDLESAWIFEKDKREEMANRATYLYAPLAKMLGVSGISKDLEDSAFKVLYPKEYFELDRVVKKRSWGTKKIFRDTQRVLTELLLEQGLSNFDIQYRTKSLYSLFKKLKRIGIGYESGNLAESLENIYDLFALRIVVGTVEECYLVETLLKQLWESLTSERDDYIKNPRSTGYRAIHNVFEIEKDFVAEVQIKTHEMHTQSEYGISSHLLYKIGDKGEKSLAVEEFKKYLKKHPEWFKDLNFWEIQKNQGFTANTSFTPNTPFKDKEYVFTPKGDIIELPKGATVVDFAYAVHTEIGNKCVGAFVNNKIVKLDYVVKTGDIVKIKTEGRRELPSKDWLGFVKTRRARHRIMNAWEQD